MTMSGFDGFYAAIDALQQAAAGGTGRLFNAPAGVPQGDGLTPAQRFSNMADDDRFASEQFLPEADPGYAWAEDLTQVPIDYWD